MPNPLDDVERLAIHTPDGLALRAELLDPRPAGSAPPSVAAVICHPHPLHGGNMHNHVVATLFADLPDQGVPAMRFNFRGTSGSEGRHGGGVDERLDIVAAIDAVTERYAAVPVLLVGYSFGALVALAVDHPAVAGWLAIAPPLAMADGLRPTAADDPRPAVIVAGTDDEFTTAEEMARLTADWRNTTVVPVAGERHFLAGAAGRLRSEAKAFVDSIAGR